MCPCKNVGLFDRIARGKLGLLTMLVGFTVLVVGSDAVAGEAAAQFGVVVRVTAAAGICPLYLPFQSQNLRGLKRSPDSWQYTGIAAWWRVVAGASQAGHS